MNQPGISSRRAGIARKLGATLLALFGAYFVIAVAVAESAVRAGSASAAAVRPRSSDAALAATVTALSEGRVGAAASFARNAVDASPLSANAAAALALAWVEQGRVDQAVSLIATSGSLGWRNPVLQQAILKGAAEQGEARVAVIRADALIRQGSELEIITPHLRALMKLPDGRRALVERLEVQPAWRAAFMTKLDKLSASELELQRQILRDLKRTSAPPTIAELGAYASTLISQKRYSEAAAFWREARGGNSRAGLITDPHFATVNSVDAPKSPFDWREGNVPGVYLRRAEGASDAEQGLQVSAEGSTAGVLLHQLLILPAGGYTLKYDLSEASAGSGEALRWAVFCDGGPELQVRSRAVGAAEPGGKRRMQAFFQVPAAGCPAQRLELRIGSLGGKAVDVRLGSLSLLKS